MVTESDLTWDSEHNKIRGLNVGTEGRAGQGRAVGGNGDKL